MSSLSVVGNANRLRRFRPGELPPAGPTTVEPHVETGAEHGATQCTPEHTRHGGGTGGETVDPVCGMTIAADSAAAHRETEAGTVYFCSAHCVATFDADPDHYTAAGKGAM
jgi:Cu+-exporting ATPase